MNCIKKLVIKRFNIMILLVWMIAVLSCVFITLKTVKSDKKDYYDQMEEAATKANEAFNAIKQYKINNNMEIPSYDKLQTGMIGSSKRTSITTTEGVLEAKRTVSNPSWAALMISIFKKSGLKEGDEVGMVFSGSFPAMNINTMIACEVYGLKYCVMISIGSSYYGANDPNFTFFDMALYLYENHYLNHQIDYVSLGGADDIAYDFHNENDRNAIINRIQASNVNFIYEENFDENIKKRMNYFYETVPNIKLFINVGGSLVGFGQGLTAFTYSGYFDNMKDGKVTEKENPDYGLIQRMLQNNVAIFNIINIKDLAEKYGLTYDPDKMPVIGKEKVYYENKYNLILPIMGLVLSIAVAVYYYFLRKKDRIDKKDRNYILKE